MMGFAIRKVVSSKVHENKNQPKIIKKQMFESQ
jgi:hypothetical protein